MYVPLYNGRQEFLYKQVLLNKVLYVKLTLEQAMKAHRGSAGIALLFL
jgi:hypothetical protein